MNTYVGIYFMTCVSVDRYIAVVHTRRLGRFRKVSRVKYICVLIWLLVFLQTISLLFRPMVKKIGDKMTCMEYFNFEEIPKLPFILLGACMMGFFLPVGIILVCYVQINLKLCRTAKENPLTDKNGHHKKAFTIILVVLLAVVICFSPYHVNIVQFMIRKILYQPSCSAQKAFKMSLQITVAFMNMNCCIDPIIYFFAFRGYKRRLLRLFKASGSVPSSSTGKSYSESNKSTSHNAGACSTSA
uniref:G-protein coupled receptor 183-like n=1 Tax=Pelodiscus sinensis TaxID=13735 RepID=K7EY92_PELSI